MASSGPRRDGTWALALLASLILHAGVGLALFLLPGPSPGTAASGYMTVDACALEVEEGGTNFLTASSDFSPLQAVLITPPVIAEPANPAIVPVETVLPLPAPHGPPPTVGEPSARAQGADVPPSGFASNVSGTKFFDVEAQGEKLVYVIDRSSSMGPNGGLRAAGEQLLASLQHLPPAARFQVIVYNRTAEPLLAGHPYWIEPTPANLQQVALRLGGLRAEGGTDHLPALRRALALGPDVLYFLTDADDLTAEILQAVSRLNAGRHTVIHAIELTTLHRDWPDMPMHVLALENRGTYRAVDLQSHHN